jgi:hypothetical protein
MDLHHGLTGLEEGAVITELALLPAGETRLPGENLEAMDSKSKLLTALFTTTSTNRTSSFALGRSIIAGTLYPAS